MSFEDLQKKWESQFSERPDGPDQKAEVDLLEQIRRNEKRFHGLIWCMVLRDAVMFSICLRLAFVLLTRTEDAAKQILSRDRPAAVAGLVLVALLTLVRIIFLKWFMLPSVPRAGAELPSRLRRDSRRFNRIILWRDLRELVACLFLILMTVIRAIHATRYAALPWIAAALFAVSIISFLAYRFQTERQRPVADDTLLGTLTLSAYYTRRQVGLLENLWWYLAPIILGLLAEGPIRLLLSNGLGQKGPFIGIAVLLVLGRITWTLNRWVARSRLRTRLVELEKMKSELSL